ncbi:micrococcal nuclease [Azospirillaceae bacterium]
MKMFSRRVAFIVFLSASVFMWLYGGSPEAKEVLRGVARVVDGDTLVISGQRVRLLGIDAPESKQTCRNASGKNYACGVASTQHLRTLIGGREVRCLGEQRDRYQRVLGVCSVGGMDLNRQMVADGMAVAYKRYSDRYVKSEQSARAASKGLWQGSFTPPEQYRHKD